MRKMRPFTHSLALLTLSLLLAGQASALSYDEGIDGDLSGDPLNPTFLAFDVGLNTITGSVTTSAPADTRDYITFTIGSGQTLDSILLFDYDDPATGPPNDGNRGYHAIDAGTTSVIPSGGTASDLLGGAHLDPLTPGTDTLPILASAPQGGTGFSTPLGPGDYTYLIQQTGPQVSNYSLGFVVTPEPTTATLLLSGLWVLGRRARRR